MNSCSLKKELLNHWLLFFHLVSKRSVILHVHRVCACLAVSQGLPLHKSLEPNLLKDAALSNFSFPLLQWRSD